MINQEEMKRDALTNAGAAIEREKFNEPKNTYEHIFNNAIDVAIDVITDELTKLEKES